MSINTQLSPVGQGFLHVLRWEDEYFFATVFRTLKTLEGKIISAFPRNPLGGKERIFVRTCTVHKCLSYSYDSFYFRELETELLLVATHFIEKDKDFRLPRNLRVGNSIGIINAKKIIADHFSVSFTDWILRFSFFLFLALVSGRSHWLGSVWPSASGQIRCSFRFVDKWSSLFGKQETGKIHYALRILIS